jgi:hypothetical protein
VKSRTKRNPAPFGSTLNALIAEYIFIVDTSIAKPRIHEGIKNGKKSYWFQPKDYEEFRDNLTVLKNS